MTKEIGDTYESLVKNYGEDSAKLYDKNVIDKLKVGQSFELNRGLTAEVFNKWKDMGSLEKVFANYNCFELASKYPKGKVPESTMDSNLFEDNLNNSYQQIPETGLKFRKTIVALKDKG